MINTDDVGKSVGSNVYLPVTKILNECVHSIVLNNLPSSIMHAAEFNVLFDITNYVATITDDVHKITANLASHIHNDMTDENH
jgi:hypothetical protein